MSLKIIDHVEKGMKRNADLVQMVSSGGKTRIYHLAIPEGTTYPYIAITDAVSEADTLTKDGGIDYETDLVMVVAVSRNISELQNIALKVKRSLEGYTKKYTDYEVTFAAFEKAEPKYVEELMAYAYEMTFSFHSNDFF